MTIVIDPQFSVYNLIGRIRDTSNILNHRRTMTLMSYEIENATIEDSAKCRIFAGFQHYSRFLPQLKRYKKLAERGEAVFVFGVPDVAVPEIPNLTYVPLQPTDQLSKEWFVVSHGLDYHSALATEEITQIDDPDEARLFTGIWTFDVEMIKILEEWLSSAVDQPPLNLNNHPYNTERHIRLMGQSIRRLLDFSQPKPRQSDTQEIIQGEIKTAVKAQLTSALEPSPAAHEQNVVILFSDLRGFTTLSEQMRPGELVDTVINPYLKAVSRAVHWHGGSIDKFVGDGVLAVFGLDSSGSDAADKALAAATDILAAMQRIPNAPPVGIGLAKGAVRVGQIGSELHQEKTVIGDVVNIAQRLSTLSHNDVWISYTLYESLSNPAVLEERGEVELRGKVERHRVYRLTSQGLS